MRSQRGPNWDHDAVAKSPFRHGVIWLEAVMAHIINEVLLYCCGAAFVTGIVLAAASLIS
jgi:hypothetical protein